MYAYDQYDQAMVDARVEEFRDQARRRLEGKLTEDQFKPLRLMNGLYLQLHAYMLRVAIPYGTLDSRQMHALADEVERVIKEEFGDTKRGIEGYDESRWIVLDYGDVVVHLFDADAREYWDLEQLWSDAAPVELPAATEGGRTD